MPLVHDSAAAARRAGASAPASPARPVVADAAPLHVAFAIDSLEASGGTELNALRTAELLAARGVRLTVVSMRADGPARARYERAGARVAPFAPGGSLVSRAAASASVRLGAFLRDVGVDVVHCHDKYSNVFAGRAARWAARAGGGRPRLVTSKRWTAAPLRHRVLNGLAYRASDRVLVNSAAVARTLVGVEWTPRARVLVVPNFLDDAVFEAPPSADERVALRAAWGVPAGDAPLVGVVARLRPEKGHADLLRAFATVAAARPDVRLVFVGDGECEGALRTLATALGLAERVHFAGHLAAAARAPHALDVAVLPSLNEGFPNALLEAMAAARPVIATDVGGVRDAVTDGETGWLVPPGDPAALAAALVRVLDDRVGAARVGAAGRALVERRYRAEPVVAGLLAEYRALAGRAVTR